MCNYVVMTTPLNFSGNYEDWCLFILFSYYALMFNFQDGHRFFLMCIKWFWCNNIIFYVENGVELNPIKGFSSVSIYFFYSLPFSSFIWHCFLLYLYIMWWNWKITNIINNNNKISQSIPINFSFSFSLTSSQQYYFKRCETEKKVFFSVIFFILECQCWNKTLNFILLSFFTCTCL